MERLSLFWTPAPQASHYIPRDVCGRPFMSEPKPNSLRAIGAASGGKGTPQYPVPRRSPRVTIDMPVEVVGKSVGGKMFRQETRTTVVNAHGAHLTLATVTDIETTLLLINKKTGAEAECRLVYQKRIESGKSEFGIEFLVPQPKFWGISFPPEDWSRAERKIPAFTAK